MRSPDVREDAVDQEQSCVDIRGVAEGTGEKKPIRVTVDGGLMGEGGDVDTVGDRSNR